MDRLDLRRATQDDDAQIRAVIAAAFPDNPKQREDITAWQYWNNPFGPTCIWVWDDDGSIVATYANFQMPAVLDGRPARAGNGVDAAIHPTYQGQRLFSPLATALYDDSRTFGIEVTMCFINNPLAIKGTTRSGWLEVGTLGVWVMAVDDAWLAHRMHLPRVAGGLVRRAGWSLGNGPAASVSLSVPEGIDALWDHAGVTTGVVRAQAWWEWRYGQHPDKPYVFFTVPGKAAAVGTVREAFGGTFLYLLELLAVDAPSARAIGRAARAHAVSHEAAGVALLALPNTTVAARAHEAGLRRLPKRLDPKPTSFGAVPNDPAAAGLQKWAWSVSWGDLDHL